MAFRADGKVARLCPTKGYTYIRLALAAGVTAPEDGYFKLDQTHPNYNALYSLALLAAVNRYTLTIRTESDITPSQCALVLYMWVDW
jgi:hypothetical protein